MWLSNQLKSTDTTPQRTLLFLAESTNMVITKHMKKYLQKLETTRDIILGCSISLSWCNSGIWFHKRSTAKRDAAQLSSKPLSHWLDSFSFWFANLESFTQVRHWNYILKAWHLPSRCKLLGLLWASVLSTLLSSASIANEPWIT